MKNDMRNLEEYPVEIRLRIFAAQLYAGANLGVWCFVDGEMVCSTCENEKELLDFLLMSDCLDFMNRKPGGWNCPVILSDYLGMVWMAEHVYRDGEPIYCTLVGPFFLSATSVKQIEKALGEHITSIAMCRQMMRILVNVPVINMTSLNQFAKMLHYTLTSEQIHVSDFVFQDDQIRKFADEEESLVFHYRDTDRVMRGEQLILQAVRDGNLNYREIIEREAYYDASLLSASGDTIRDAKNSVIIFTALCCRAAMEGGLPSKTAKELERRYSTEIENCATVTKMKNVYCQMLDEICKKVHDYKESPMISKATKKACDYIRANVRSPLSVEEIANEAGYTPYYFNRKFYTEMGIRVNDYIKQARCEYAKVELLTTKKSIQEISDSLNFSTRSYFSRVFHEVVGVTPAAYREQTRIK